MEILAAEAFIVGDFVDNGTNEKKHKALSQLLGGSNDISPQRTVINKNTDFIVLNPKLRV